MRTFTYIFILVFFCGAEAHAGICKRIWEKQDARGNANAIFSGDDYEQTRNRTLSEVKSLLGPVYAQALEDLMPGELVIDTGAGYGLAGIQIANEKKAKVVLINSQDVVDRSLDFYKFPFATQPLKVMFEIGMAHQVLPHYKNSAKILQETFGSFYYGRERNQALEDDYDALAPNGIGVIALGGDADYTQDLVLIGGSEITLIDYLITEYADVFSVVPTIAEDDFRLKPASVEALVMKKSSRRPKLDLKLVIDERRSGYLYNKTETGFVVPDMVFQVKKSK